MVVHRPPGLALLAVGALLCSSFTLGFLMMKVPPMSEVRGKPRADYFGRVQSQYPRPAATAPLPPRREDRGDSGMMGQSEARTLGDGNWHSEWVPYTIDLSERAKARAARAGRPMAPADGALHAPSPVQRLPRTREEEIEPQAMSRQGRERQSGGPWGLTVSAGSRVAVTRQGDCSLKLADAVAVEVVAGPVCTGRNGSVRVDVSVGGVPWDDGMDWSDLRRGSVASQLYQELQRRQASRKVLDAEVAEARGGSAAVAAGLRAVRRLACGAAKGLAVLVRHTRLLAA